MTSLLTLLLLMSPPADTAHLPTLDEWVHDWEVQRDFTIAVADKMPAENYGFRASPEEMQFGVMALHIANSFRFRFEQVSGVKSDVRIPAQVSKDDILKAIRDSFDYAIRVLPKSRPSAWPASIKWTGKAAKPPTAARSCWPCWFTPLTIAHNWKCTCA